MVTIEQLRKFASDMEGDFVHLYHEFIDYVEGKINADGADNPAGASVVESTDTLKGSADAVVPSTVVVDNAAPIPTEPYPGPSAVTTDAPASA